jgi:hypothetical protein
MSSISGVGGSANTWSSASASRLNRQQAMFNKIDSDGSGDVSKSELQSLFADAAQRSGTTSSTSSDDVFAKLDTNSDGSLTQSEMEAGMKGVKPEAPSTEAFAKSRKGAGGPQGAGGPPPPPDGDDASASSTSSATQYDPLDVNKDGVVSEQERAAGELKDVVKSLLKAADTDGDKQVSDTEFSTFKDMVTQAASQLSATSSSSSGTSSSGTDTASQQTASIKALADAVLKAYASAAANSAASQSYAGSTLSMAA